MRFTKFKAKISPSMKRIFLAFPLVIALTAISAAAGDEYSYKKEFGISFGFSPDSCDCLIGRVADQQYYEASLNLGYVLRQSESYALKYRASLVPFALVRGEQTAVNYRSSRAVYAGGAEPIGFQLNLRNRRKIQPFAALTGGFLYFTEQVPVADSSQFNFTFSFGGGVEILSAGHSIALGYRYHHISNGYTAPLNPGIDSQILSIGFSFKR